VARSPTAHHSPRRRTASPGAQPRMASLAAKRRAKTGGRGCQYTVLPSERRECGSPLYSLLATGYWLLARSTHQGQGPSMRQQWGRFSGATRASKKTSFILLRGGSGGTECTALSVRGGGRRGSGWTQTQWESNSGDAGLNTDRRRLATAGECSRPSAESRLPTSAPPQNVPPGPGRRTRCSTPGAAVCVPLP
jgi:hypothetical protein